MCPVAAQCECELVDVWLSGRLCSVYSMDISPPFVAISPPFVLLPLWPSLLRLQCMETLVQFAIFLESHLSAEEYASKFPDLDTLQGTYHLPPDIAFCLMRPQLNHAVRVCGVG